MPAQTEVALQRGKKLDSLFAAAESIVQHPENSV